MTLDIFFFSLLAKSPWDVHTHLMQVDKISLNKLFTLLYIKAHISIKCSGHSTYEKKKKSPIERVIPYYI